jgi:hypothetical protein
VATGAHVEALDRSAIRHTRKLQVFSSGQAGAMTGDRPVNGRNRCRSGEGRARAVARGVKMGRPPKLTQHQQREAIKRRDRGEESLTEIGRSYNVSAATISRLATTVA